MRLIYYFVPHEKLYVRSRQISQQKGVFIMKNRILRSAGLFAATLTVLLISVLTANAALCGDVSEDGLIGAGDARTILRASVRLETLSDELMQIADTDENGRITAADARTVLRMSVKLEPERHFFKGEVTLEPTCLTDGTMLKTCTECDEAPYTVVLDALGHDNEVEIVEAVTCEKDGTEKHTCKRCGNVENVTIPLGHIWNMADSTCTEDQYCERGNHIGIPKKGHTATWGKCTRCGIFNTEKYAAEAATIKAKFNEAKTAFDTAYSFNSYNSMLDGISWKVLPQTQRAKPYYQTAKAAYEAAYTACGNIPEFATIKALLDKNIKNLEATLIQVDKILAVKYYDANNYDEMILPLEEINDLSKDSVTATNKKLVTAIIW